MARNVQRITIESILGGHSQLSHMSGDGEFQTSLGIDPSLPKDALSYSPTAGMLRPTSSFQSGANLNNIPLWMVQNPKNTSTYVLDAQGSVYAGSTGISDGGNEGGTGTGNGSEYYDNYVYFAKNTTIARYGPLNGSPTLNGDYWGTTLGKTALSNTTYPTVGGILINLPNHVLKRHSDGKLYIADVVDNQGTLHYIKTRKTTVEGDTDDGSTYDKINVGFGLWPTAMESYGTTLVVAFYEGTASTFTPSPAKIGFWDTTSENFNEITWVEFPDPLITSIKNLNGVLYVFSGRPGQIGVRISRHIGGSSFEEVKNVPYATCPLPGASVTSQNRLFFGTYIQSYPDESSAVMALGLPGVNDNALFAVQRQLNGTGMVTAITIKNDVGNTVLSAPYSGWTSSALHALFSGEDTSSNYGSATVPRIFWSQIFKIGQKFKITKISIPFGQVLAANMTLVPKIYTDSGAGTTYTLQTINSTNYPNQKRVVLRPENLTGEHNFFLELSWQGSALLTVTLPIIIEYELIDD